MKISILSAAFATLCTSAAFAQADPMQMARTMAANQVGVMEYCQGKGWADQAAVDTVRSSMAGVPGAAGSAEASAAEATGKSGSLLNNGTPMTLAAMAGQTNTTEQALCGKLAESAKMMASQSAAMPSMSGNLPGMPAMPNGMKMPAMPGMPKPQ